MTPLQEQFPARETQIRALQDLIGTVCRQLYRYGSLTIQPPTSSPPSIFIYGHTAVAKSSLVKAFFDQYDRHESEPSYAMINCIECHSLRLLFEHIVNALAAWDPDWSNGISAWKRIDSIDVFVSTLQELFQNQKSRSSKYIILDKAERLRDMPPTLIPVLLRLGELISYPITVIFITMLPPAAFPSLSFTPAPVILHFPSYNKTEIVDILLHLCEESLEVPNALCEKDAPDDNASVSSDSSCTSTAFIRTFIEIIYDAFHATCKDIRELCYAVRILWPKFIQPIESGQVDPDDIQKLYKLSQRYFVAAMDKLYLREISLSEWNKANDSDLTDLNSTRDQIDLPYYSKFLLIASYLASYNPARLDVRFFARGPEGVRKKRGGGTRVSTARGSTKLSQQLLGPKPFPIERMLAIFYSILPDPIDGTVEIQMRITSLIALRLLTRSSPADRLDSPKVRCNVSFDVIKRVSRSVRFDITRWLHSTD